MKKFKGIMFAFTLAISVALGGILISGCGGPANGKLTTKELFSNVHDMYSFAGVTSTNFLGVTGMSQLSNQEVADEVIDYVRMADGMVGGKYLPTSSKETLETGEFKYKVTTKIKSITGVETVYVMYYNESVPSENDRDATDEDDYEVSTSLEGKIEVGEATYNFTGSKEVEADEVEIEFTVVAADNRKVIISQEKETDEVEYKYEIKNGQTTEKEFEVEFEKENDKLEIEFVSIAGTSEKRYKIEQNKVDGSTTYEIKVNNSEKITVKIVEVENVKKYEFTMQDGEKIYYNV